MSEATIHGKPIEQYWTELTAKHLVGKKKSLTKYQYEKIWSIAKTLITLHQITFQLLRYKSKLHL